MRSASRAVARGVPLSRALVHARFHLDATDLALVRAGERSGELARVLGLLAARLQHLASARRGLARALVYPAILLTSAVAVVSCASAYVLPSFAALYAGAGAELPTLTTALLAAGPLLAEAGPPGAVVTAAALVGVAQARRRSPRVAHALDSASLRAPVIGPLVLARERESLYDALAVLTRAGLDIDHALGLAATSVGNRAVATTVASVRRALLRGSRVSEAIAGTRLDVDGLDSAILRTAELTGDYPAAFARLASTAADERRHRTAAAIAAVEPLTTLVIALLVGTVVLALYQPILGSSTLLLGATQ